MASRKPYECFKCRDNGYANTMVYLAGKDDQGRTIQLEEDGTKHVHKGRTGVPTTVSDSRTAQDSRSETPTIDDSSIVTHLTKVCEDNQQKLVSLEEKIDRLTRLVYSKQQQG